LLSHTLTALFLPKRSLAVSRFTRSLCDRASVAITIDIFECQLLVRYDTVNGTR